MLKYKYYKNIYNSLKYGGKPSDDNIFQQTVKQIDHQNDIAEEKFIEVPANPPPIDNPWIGLPVNPPPIDNPVPANPPPIDNTIPTNDQLNMIIRTIYNFTDPNT